MSLSLWSLFLEQLCLDSPSADTSVPHYSEGSLMSSVEMYMSICI